MKTDAIYTSDRAFTIGGCHVVRARPGDRLTIVAAGITLHEALAAHAELATDGMAVRVIDLYGVKPVDTATLRRAATSTRNLVLTVEDHYAEGGLGDAVLNALSGEPVQVTKQAVTDVPRSGKPAELLAMYGLDAASIAKRARELVG